MSLLGGGLTFRPQLSIEAGRLAVCCFAGESSGDVSGIEVGGQSVVEFGGRQESEFRRFLNALAAFLEVPIGVPPSDISVPGAARCVCAACGRTGAPGSPKCLYCGGEVKAE